jgi:hypothetical protein
MLWVVVAQESCAAINTTAQVASSGPAIPFSELADSQAHHPSLRHRSLDGVSVSPRPDISWPGPTPSQRPGSYDLERQPLPSPRPRAVKYRRSVARGQRRRKAEVRGQHHCLRRQILVLCDCAARQEEWQAATEELEPQETRECGLPEPMDVIRGSAKRSRARYSVPPAGCGVLLRLRQTSGAEGETGRLGR